MPSRVLLCVALPGYVDTRYRRRYNEIACIGYHLAVGGVSLMPFVSLL